MATVRSWGGSTYGGQNGYPIEEESPLAYCDSDGAGDVVVDNSLVTNEINIEGYVGVSVAFDMVLRSFDANGTNAYVEVSTDGENWEVAQEWEMTQQEEQYHLYPCEVNLTPFIQGANSIWIRWHYQAHFQYFWAIDNVLVEGIAAGGDPELTITDGLVWPTRLSPGNNVNFTMTISNLGGSDAPPFQVDWFQHLDAPPEIGDTGEQQYMIDGLAAQMSTTIEGTMMMQSVGNYEMYFFVDSQGEVTETNEDNNIPLPIPITVIRDAFYTETFDAFPPAGWTIEDNNMAGLYWNQSLRVEPCLMAAVMVTLLNQMPHSHLSIPMPQEILILTIR